MLTWCTRSRGGSMAISVFGCVLVLLLYLVLAVRGGPVSAAPTAAQATTTAGTGTLISTRSTKLGLIVVAGGHSHTAYLFTRDGTNVSHCGPTCRQTWIPVKSKSKPRAGTGIKATHLSRTSSNQVSYYGHPLYYYSADTKAGQTRGQGITAFSGRWWVVAPNGKAGTGATVRLHSTPDGNLIAGTLENGRTLYALSTETSTTVKCTGTCTSTWPVLITTGLPKAGTGVTKSLLGTVLRPNGARQVTYNGHPLYYYAGDSGAGTDYGDCFPQSPGYWHGLTSAGHYVRSCTTSPSPSSTSTPPTATCDQSPPSDATVTTATKGALGTVLVDIAGCTVYEYSPDPADTATINLPSTWPPVTTVNVPTGVGLGCTLGTTNTASTTDGTTQQVTCNHRPLYYYAPDHYTDQACGQGSLNVWFVLDTNGAAVAGSAVCPAT